MKNSLLTNDISVLIIVKNIENVNTIIVVDNVNRGLIYQ